MPTKRYRITNKTTGETKVIDWEGEAAPTSEDVKSYLARQKTPNPTNQQDSYPTLRKYYDKVKEGLDSAYSTINTPLLPERNFGANSTYYPFKASTPVLGNVGIPSAGSMYDSVRDFSSPMGIASAVLPFAEGAVRKFSGVKEVKPTEVNPSKYDIAAEGAEVPPSVKREFAPVGSEGNLVKENNVPKPSVEENIYQNVLRTNGGTKVTPDENPNALVKVGEQGLAKNKFTPVGPNEISPEEGLVKTNSNPIEQDLTRIDEVGPARDTARYTNVNGNEPVVDEGSPKQIKGSTKRPYGSFNDEWSDYVNARQAGKLEGDYVGKKFSYLDQDVREGDKPASFDQLDNNHPLNLLQQNLKEGNFHEVRSFLDNIHEELNQAGVETQYKEDYLPQMWDNTPEEISNALGRKLGLKPSFTFESFYKDYQEGIDAGLTPKFERPSELLNYYTSYARKAIADNRFFNYLKETNQVRPSKPSSDWKPLSGEYFPKAWLDHTYYAEPDTARLITNYFTDPSKGSWGEKLLNDTSGLVSKTTRTVLGFHMPGTAWSLHGINTGISNALWGENNNPLSAIKRLGESAYYLTRPEEAGRFLDNNPTSAINAVKDGGLAISNYSSDIGKPLISGDGIAAKGLNLLTSPKPLFQQVIPNLMLKSYERLVTELTSKEMSYKEAARTAGEQVNDQFGVINREMSTNPAVFDKTVNNVKRILTLAPNWLESRLGLAKGTAEALMNPNDPRGKKYLSGVSNFLVSYAALNVMNYIANGKSMLQNDPGKELSLAVGKDSKGKTIYVNPYAGAIDFIKIPLAIAHASLEGNLGESTKDLRSRASEPAQFAIDLMSNTDWKGSPILGDKGQYNKVQSVGKQVGNLTVDAMSHFLPIGAEGIADYAQDKISPEEAAARVLQVPLSFKTEGKTGKRKGSYAPVGPRVP